jgi:hypothetical protein
MRVAPERGLEGARGGGQTQRQATARGKWWQEEEEEISPCGWAHQVLRARPQAIGCLFQTIRLSRMISWLMLLITKCRLWNDGNLPLPPPPASPSSSPPKEEREREGGGFRDRRGGQGRRAGTGSRAAIFWSASNMRGFGTVCYSEESIQLRVPY